MLVCFPVIVLYSITFLFSMYRTHDNRSNLSLPVSSVVLFYNSSQYCFVYFRRTRSYCPRRTINSQGVQVLAERSKCIQRTVQHAAQSRDTAPFTITTPLLVIFNQMLRLMYQDNKSCSGKCNYLTRCGTV